MDIPPEIQTILKTLQKAGFEAYAVGGCVRDFALQQKPKDWDITTNAKPEDIAKLFPQSFYENDFGTVSVITNSPDPSLKTVEITPFRIEGKYSDKRHPDAIKFAKTLEEDLARRDFTVNALALAESQTSKPTPRCRPKVATATEGSQDYQLLTTDYSLIDLFGGQEDLKNQIIRAVGQPQERFQEDALRMIRAVRFAVTLGDKLWEIEEQTQKAILDNSPLLRFISQERIRDELIKIIMSPNGALGIELLRRLGLLNYILPELEAGFNIEQNKHHIYQIYQHNLLSLNFACRKNFSFSVRWAALLHDIAKPQTKQGLGQNATFHNHEVLGAKMARQILNRLRFPKKDADKIVKLIRFHLFYYNVDEVSESSVRRLLRNVGPENIEELLQVRYSDRKGSGVPKAEPYKLRHLKYLFDKVRQDPILPKMLKINGNEIMQLLNIKAGPKIGQVLSYLLSLVLADPAKNTAEFLTQEAQRLGQLSDAELANLAQNAKTEIEQVETKKDTLTKQKYWVT